MRTSLKVLVPALSAGVLAAMLPVGAAAAIPTVPGPLFGQHVAGIAAEAPSTLPTVGSIRLWDSGLSWRDLEPTKDGYTWTALDQALTNAEAKYGADVEILFTLGNTPKWAAKVKDSPSRLYGPGSNSHPKRDRHYLDFLSDLIAHAGDRIDAYQIWNEANIRSFYLGTPTQLAKLTVKAGKIIKAKDPSAVRVAASTTVRASGPVASFGKAYGPAMQKANAWKYVDAVSAHFYPPATSGPDTRVSYIKTVKSYYAKYGAGRKALWDTEMNYGDNRSYMDVQKTYTGKKAAAYVARTYIDSMRYGVSRVHWYGWDIYALGTHMTSPDAPHAVTTGGTAFLEVQDWMAGKKWYGCTTSSRITICTVKARGESRDRILFTTSKSRKYKVPSTTTLHKLDGSSKQLAKGKKIRITTVPVMLG